MLVGPMAVGKSTVARELAARLGWPVRDSDDDLRAERGFSGRELAATVGVEALHRWESVHLRRAVAAAGPSIVAAAASVVDDPLCREALGDQFVVWLRASAETRAARSGGPGGAGTATGAGTTSGAADHRRDLGPDRVRALVELADRRERGYAAVADLTVDAETAAPAALADTICAALPEALRPDRLRSEGRRPDGHRPGGLPGRTGRGDLRS